MADVFAYLYGFGAGGDFTKSVIIVTAPTGSTVTCTKGTVTKTAAERNGEWWFKGLEIGTWTLKATLGGQTASRTVNITQFDVYRIAMSYFAATIAVTYPAGSTCTCSKDGEVLTAPNTSGSYTFPVTSAGTWTITIANSAVQLSKSQSVSVTSNGQLVSISMDYYTWIVKNGQEIVNLSLYNFITKTAESGYVVITGYDFGYHYGYASCNIPSNHSLVIEGQFYLESSLFGLAVWNKDTVVARENYLKFTPSTSTTKQIMDVSAYAGAYKVGFRTGAKNTIKIKNFYIAPNSLIATAALQAQLNELDAAYVEGVNSI